MSSIHKLGIIGIRSYNPEEEVVIKFFKPLTLILGKNGAGKTTIIECLKMAVAGSFPPNSQQGKTFICDPKLVGKPEVKAKIEIAFTAVNQRKILGVRTFQLTNTAKKSEFRQMEQVLKAKDLNGDIISVTQKCAEMDRQIPELLGVSQAVLDNVIFCHQEESLWPFGDTAKLKSIFDELFDTTRYTTLLENLKKVQKEYKKSAKESLNEFELHKKDFDILMRGQKTALKDATDINVIQKQLDETNKKIRALKDKMKPVESKSEIERSLNIIKFKISELQRQRNTLLKSLEDNHAQVFSENSMEELNRCKEELTNNYKKKEEDLVALEEKLEALRKKKDDLQKKLEQIQYLERDQSEINIKIKDYRERILQLITIDLVGNENDAKLNEKVLVKAQAQLDSMTKEITSESERLEEQEQNMENDLNNFRSSLSSKEGLSENNENELRSTNLKIQKLAVDVDKYNKQNKGPKKNLDDDLEGMDDNIDNLKDNLAMFNENKDRRTKELMEITEKMRNNAKNKEIILKYQDYSALQKELNTADQDYKNNEDELWMLSKNLSDISNNKFETGENTDDLIQAVYSYQDQLETEKEVLDKKKEKANDTVKEVNSYLQIKTSDLNDKMKLNDEFTTKMESNKMQALLEGDGDFMTQYKSIKEQLEKVEKRDLTMKYTEDIMKQLLDRSQKNKKCAFCTRKLDDTELNKVVTKCQEIVSKSKSFTANEQRSLEELKHQKSLFKSMKTEYEEFRKNRAIIAQLKKEIQTKEKEKTISQQQLNNLKTSLTNIENIQANISNILKVYEKLEKAQDERNKVKVKIEQMLRMYPGLKEYKGSAFGVADDKELQARMENINSDIVILTDKITNTNNEIARLQQQKDEMEKRKANQQRDSFDIENKTKELEGLKTRRNELDESTKKLKDEITILRNRIEGLEEKRKQIRNARKQLDEKKSTRFMRLNEFTEEYKRLYEVWVRSQDKKKKNTESDALKEKLSKEIQGVNDDIEKCSNQVQKLKENIKEKNTNLRLIDDNIQLRSFETELEELVVDRDKQEKTYEEIKENEKLNMRIQAEIDKESASVYQSEGKASRIRDEYERSMGEMKNKWGTTEKAYIEKLFEANVNQYVAEDLDIYITHLEKALMLFHKQKMGEINKIIADLWIKTYQGTDIRKIEIKSDTEPNARNKSFNYRIVFFNADGKELDMKGRCSMGQKVIASIVIRLGLAEAFCTNCGILALDEPTTNLDKDHIKKLAKELSNLIEERMTHENFQLIIITHDKEFLREVSEHAEEYYRVYKDNNAFSKIERKRTSTL